MSTAGPWSFQLALCVADETSRLVLTGDPTLLTHGVDQYGFVCGTKNTYNGTVVDLTEQKYLYYLDPFALLNTSNLPWAASICVSECPSVDDLCGVTSLPCRNSTQYRCVSQLCQLHLTEQYESMKHGCNSMSGTGVILQVSILFFHAWNQRNAC